MSSTPTDSTDTAHKPPVHDLYAGRAVLLALIAVYAAVLVRTAWLSDDAYITLRTVANWLQGYGPVWNVAERVQAYTHPLWMMLLAGAGWQTGELYYTSTFLSIILSVAAVALLAWRLPRSLTGAIVALLILISSKAFVDYSTSGLENPLLHLLLVVFFARYFQPNRSTSALLGLSLLSALILLTRMDTLLLILPALAYALWQQRSLKALGVAAAGLLPVLAWEIFSLFYYGFPFPNTAYAKLNAGIEPALMVQQGLFYVMRLVDLDALTAVAIIVALVLPFYRRSWARVAIAAGIALYLLYIVRIGGDFMAGRFFAAPLLCATVIIGREWFPPAGRPASLLLYAAIVGLGLVSPRQASLLANSEYAVPKVNNKQIEDIRGHHFQFRGLQLSNEWNRLDLGGIVLGSTAQAIRDACVGMGVSEFRAGPHVHVIDVCGLTEPLLARLPAIHTVDIYAGHYFRTVPDGYRATLRTGQNQIADPDLAAYYEKLALITRGALWDRERLRTILRFNLGAYDHLVDEKRYRYPDRLAVHAAALAKARLVDPTFKPVESKQTTAAGAYKVGPSGIEINLGETWHAELVELGFDGSYFTAGFLRDGALLAETTVATHSTQLGADRFTALTVPAAVVQDGYTALRITPQTPGTFELSYVEPLDLADPDLSLERLLHLYTYTYYRGDKAARAVLLPLLLDRLSEVSPKAWAPIGARKRFDLLQIPDVALQALVEAATSSVVLTDEAGTPRLRFIGAEAKQILLEEVENDESRWRPALDFYLVFESLDPPDREYTAWFHIDARDRDAELMAYDRIPDPPLPDWPMETLQMWETPLQLEPGEYDISFGFWTPGDRHRLYVNGGDDYWINLGTFSVHE